MFYSFQELRHGTRTKATRLSVCPQPMARNVKGTAKLEVPKGWNRRWKTFEVPQTPKTLAAPAGAVLEDVTLEEMAQWSAGL